MARSLSAGLQIFSGYFTGVSAILMGLMLMGVSFYWRVRHAEDLQSAIHAKATIESIRPAPQGAGSGIPGQRGDYLIIASFLREDGKWIGPIEKDCPAEVCGAFTPGDSVPILYYPNLPVGFWFDGDQRVAKLGQFLGWVGLAFLLLGLAALFLTRSAHRQHKTENGQEPGSEESK